MCNREETIEKAISSYFNDSKSAINGLNNHLDVIGRMALGIYNSQLAGHKLLVGGNGGSCSDAEHFAGEMVCTYSDPDRRAFSAISLTNNASAVTAWANDFGFDSYFLRQVQALGQSGDILFLISTGGGDREKGYSMNLVDAADKALEMGLTLYSIVGKAGGELARISHEHVHVASFKTSHIQEAHIAIIHAVCESLDALARSDRDN